MKSGFVSVVGRPNVGKSTLINSIIGKKVAITSSKAQTTRNIIQGIYNEEDTQIVFVDTPGIHKPNSKLGKVLNNQAYYSMQDTDFIMFVVDTSGLGRGDEFIINEIKKVNKPVILVINKIDTVSKEELIKIVSAYNELYDFADIVPISALKKNNIKELIKVLKKYLPDEICYYGKNDITNRSIEFRIAEIVREKVFNQTKEEVPHSITCKTDSITRNNNSYNILVSIIVDRDSLKKIIIGARGEKLKKIGTSARIEIEQIIGKKVYLELFVKTVKKWREKEKYLDEYGFNDFKE